MLPKSLFFCFLCLFWGCVSSSEFIPEPDFTLSYSRYLVKRWEDVEVVRERPRKAFSIAGELVIKGGEAGELQEDAIRKELFQKKIDGVWILQKSKETVDGLGFESMDSRGHTTHTYQYKNEIPVWRGICYRYKN